MHPAEAEDQTWETKEVIKTCLGLRSFPMLKHKYHQSRHKQLQKGSKCAA